MIPINKRKAGLINTTPIYIVYQIAVLSRPCLYYPLQIKPKTEFHTLTGTLKSIFYNYRTLEKPTTYNICLTIYSLQHKTYNLQQKNFSKQPTQNQCIKKYFSKRV